MIDAAITVLGAAVAVLVFGNVLSRFVFNFDVAWSGELASFALVWATFLGAAAATRRGAHMRIGEILEALAGRPRAVAEIIVALAVIAVLLLLAGYGTVIAERQWAQLTTVLYWPQGLLYAAMPAGAAVTLPFVLRDLVRACRALA
ncbi:TRAP transporter small permease [Elioraea sp.]|uniref:TRAP transporter small permease n=1 Tax=Elioraea sp. TaxID=2185103 RepID=UPI003F708DCA